MDKAGWTINDLVFYYKDCFSDISITTVIFYFSAYSFSLLSVPTGTREAAFVYALSAATISHTIARACTSGDLRLCSCGPIPSEIPEPGYRWGGCADNLHFGLLMGSKFSDAPMKMKRSGSHANKLMHLHNSEVGRQVREFLHMSNYVFDFVFLELTFI